MPQESLGYIQLEWTCPTCGARNPGSAQVCSGCGAPQPDDVKFEQPSTAEIIQDEAQVARAKLGPDIHCAYCNARNPANARVCVQCGADLTKGHARVAGQVVGAFRSGPVPEVACAACGTKNPETALRCSQCGASMPAAAPSQGTAPRQSVAAMPTATGSWSTGQLMALVAGLVLFLGVCSVCAFMVFNTEGVSGDVASRGWERRIEIQGLVPVSHEDWHDEIPQDAEVGACTQKPHHTQDSPAPNAEKVCGTPYTIDQGNGFAETVQDCQYQVYADWCEYEVDEWRTVDELRLTGSDARPQWPVVRLGAGQREGDHHQTYTIEFSTEDGIYTYTTNDEREFDRYQIGSNWTLNVNSFGSVMSVEEP